MKTLTPCESLRVTDGWIPFGNHRCNKELMCCMWTKLGSEQVRKSNQVFVLYILISIVYEPSVGYCDANITILVL